LQQTEAAPRHENLRRIISLLWVIVFALSLAFCYFASSFCITLILASFLSILIDPVISFLERLRIPRSVSAACLIGLGLIGMILLTYASYNRFANVVDSFPAYAERIRGMVRPLNEKISKVQESAGSLNPDVPAKKVTEVKIRQASEWPSYLVRGFGSVSGTILILGVLPFLMFFMLIRKEKWYQNVAQLLGPQVDAAEFANRLAQMIRRFAIGNLAVGALLSVLTITILFGLKIQGAVLLGIISGMLNLIPYVGFVLAALVPLAAGFLQSAPISSLLIIGIAVSAFHLVATNFLIPRFIGPRINVGPVAATAGILFWGWLWGVMGILLAIPLTGLIKLIADCHPSLLPLSNMLGESAFIERGENEQNNELRVDPSPATTPSES
jgi:predicted PurR-regulated permease PerM